MANDNNADRSNGNNNGNQKNTPDFDIFHPRDKGPWQKLGVGYTNRDGSITLLVEYVPVGSSDGRVRLQLRAHEARDAEGKDAKDTRDPREGRTDEQAPAARHAQASARL